VLKVAVEAGLKLQKKLRHSFVPNYPWTSEKVVFKCLWTSQRL